MRERFLKLWLYFVSRFLFCFLNKPSRMFYVFWDTHLEPKMRCNTHIVHPIPDPVYGHVLNLETGIYRFILPMRSSRHLAAMNTRIVLAQTFILHLKKKKKLGEATYIFRCYLNLLRQEVRWFGFSSQNDTFLEGAARFLLGILTRINIWLINLIGKEIRKIGNEVLHTFPALKFCIWHQLSNRRWPSISWLSKKEGLIFA